MDWTSGYVQNINGQNLVKIDESDYVTSRFCKLLFPRSPRCLSFWRYAHMILERFFCSDFGNRTQDRSVDQHIAAHHSVLLSLEHKSLVLFFCLLRRVFWNRAPLQSSMLVYTIQLLCYVAVMWQNRFAFKRVVSLARKGKQWGAAQRHEEIEKIIYSFFTCLCN